MVKEKIDDVQVYSLLQKRRRQKQPSPKLVLSSSDGDEEDDEEDVFAEWNQASKRGKTRGRAVARGINRNVESPFDDKKEQSADGKKVEEMMRAEANQSEKEMLQVIDQVDEEREYASNPLLNRTESLLRRIDCMRKVGSVSDEDSEEEEKRRSKESVTSNISSIASINKKPISKPPIPQDRNELQLRVRTNGDSIDNFTVLDQSDLRCLLQDCCKHYDVPEEAVKISLDGELLQMDKNAKFYELENDDIIEAQIDFSKKLTPLQHQCESSKKSYSGPMLSLKVRVNGKYTASFELAQDAPFSELIERFCSDYSVSQDNVRMLVDGEVICLSKNSKFYDLESEDLIEMQAPEKDYSEKTALAADNNERITPNTAKYMSLICCINQSKYENYKILPNALLVKLVDGICARNGVKSRHDVRMEANGETLNPNHTAADYCLIDGDSISVTISNAVTGSTLEGETIGVSTSFNSLHELPKITQASVDRGSIPRDRQVHGTTKGGSKASIRAANSSAIPVDSHGSLIEFFVRINGVIARTKFQMHEYTSVSKLQTRLCEKYNLQKSGMILRISKRRLDTTKTIKENNLGMKCVVEVEAAKAMTSPLCDADIVNVRLQLFVDGKLAEFPIVMRVNQQFDTIMKDIADHYNCLKEQLIIKFDGQAISSSQSPQSHGIPDGSRIDATILKSISSPMKNFISFRVRVNDKKIEKYKMPEHYPVSKLLDTLCKRHKSIESTNITLKVNGLCMDPTKPLQSFSLENGEIIEATIVKQM